jgi:membrane fusion protein (multidrug efflux system)
MARASSVCRVALAVMLCLPPAGAAAQAPDGPPAVGVVRVERTQITQTNEFVGRIQAIGRDTIVARVTAFLEKRPFVEGSEVKKGDLLYQLQQPPFQAQVDADKAKVAQLEAELTYAERQLARAKYLLNTPAGEMQIYDQDLANERSYAAQVAAAKAQLKVDEINLSYTEIRAPVAGKISATDVTVGNVVTPTSGTLATLVSQDPMYVLFPVAMPTALELRDRYAKKGGYRAVRIKLRLPTGKIYGQVGKVDYAAPTVTQNTDTLTLRGVVPNPVFPGMKAGEPGSRELVDGEFVTVLLQGVEPILVLVIPRTAVLSDQQGDYVYVVNAQNKAEQRPIVLSDQSTPSTAVVTHGLTEGELVITEGVQRVQPGEVVSPGPASPPPASPASVAKEGATGSSSDPNAK